MKGKVAVRYFHVIEKGIDPQKFLNILIKIFTILFERFSLSIKSSRKIFQRLIMISRRMYRLIDIPGEVVQS